MRKPIYFRPSSVWCYGSTHTQRRCRFINLCYKTDTEDYLFLLDQNLSIKSGVPLDRFSPALLDLSSVSAHNQYYFNYVEIPFPVLQNNLSQKYKIEKLLGKTVVMSRFKPDNLMHYFHDDILPLYFTLHEIDSKPINRIFLDDIWPQVFNKPFDENIFKKLFPKWFTRHQLNNNTIYCFEEAFVGLNKAMTWYDYGFRTPQSPIIRSSEESLLISRTIRRFTNEILPMTHCSTHYVIFISRKFNRKILNEEILLKLISKVTKLSVIKIEELTDNFENIINKVFCAKIMIGVHGSALILSLFLKPGSSLIELFPFAINPNYFTPYKTFTQLNGMRINYFYWKNTFINNTITHREYPTELGGIEQFSDKLQMEIMGREDDVPQHLCCSDPYWLFRIYQDTIVDTDSFNSILEKASKNSSQISTIAERLEPGVVSHLKCQYISNNDKYIIRIVWQKPWNLDYIEYKVDIKYEILTQEVPSVSAKSTTVAENEFSFVAKFEKTYNVWIRCQLNDISGPFNTKPLIC